MSLKGATAVSAVQDEETWEDWVQRLTELIEQMMFVSGETAEPSPDTTGMIEEIVRQQVIEMVRTIPKI